MRNRFLVALCAAGLAAFLCLDLARAQLAGGVDGNIRGAVNGNVRDPANPNPPPVGPASDLIPVVL